MAWCQAAYGSSRVFFASPHGCESLRRSRAEATLLVLIQTLCNHQDGWRPGQQPHKGTGWPTAFAEHNSNSACVLSGVWAAHQLHTHQLAGSIILPVEEFYVLLWVISLRTAMQTFASPQRSTVRSGYLSAPQMDHVFGANLS